MFFIILIRYRPARHWIHRVFLESTHPKFFCCCGAPSAGIVGIVDCQLMQPLSNHAEPSKLAAWVSADETPLHSSGHKKSGAPKNERALQKNSMIGYHQLFDGVPLKGLNKVQDFNLLWITYCHSVSQKMMLPPIRLHQLVGGGSTCYGNGQKQFQREIFQLSLSFIKDKCRHLAMCLHLTEHNSMKHGRLNLDFLKQLNILNPFGCWTFFFSFFSSPS